MSPREDDSDREAAIDRAIVEGYTRIPPGTPDEWGDVESDVRDLCAALHVAAGC